MMAIRTGGSFLLSASVCTASASHLMRAGGFGDGRRAGRQALVKSVGVAGRGEAPITILCPEKAVSDEFAARLAAWLALVAMNTEGTT